MTSNNLLFNVTLRTIDSAQKGTRKNPDPGIAATAEVTELHFFFAHEADASRAKFAQNGYF